MTVIDFRARPNTPEYMAMYPDDYETFTRIPGHSHPGSRPLSAFISALDDNGIDIAVFTGRQVKADGEIVRGVSNDYIAECVDAYPDRLVGFAGLDLTEDIDANLTETQRVVEDLGLAGLSIDPYMVGLPDDRRLYPLYAKAQELGVPVILTMGPNVGAVGKLHDPYPVDRIATDFPDLTIVCAHAAWPEPTEFVNLAYRRPNVYLDPSIYVHFPGAEPFIEAAADLIQDQVVYASAFPFSPLEDIERFKQFPIGEEAMQKILSENAARILDR